MVITNIIKLEFFSTIKNLKSGDEADNEDLECKNYEDYDEYE